MQVTILAIITDGTHCVSLHQSHLAAWSQLMSFIDARWSERMGSTAPPADDEAKAQMFFRHNDDDLYAIVDADVSELQEALGSASDPVIG